MKRLLAIIICIVQAYSTKAQSWRVEIDTLYSSIMWLDNKVILGNENNTIAITERGEVVNLPKVDEMISGVLNIPLVRIGVKAYPIRDDLSINTNVFAYVDNLMNSNLESSDKCIVYRGELDSIFVSKFDDPRRKYILKDAYYFHRNNQYLRLRQEYPDERTFVYHYDLEKLIEIPLDFDRDREDHGWLLVRKYMNVDLDFRIHIKNLDLEDIITFEDGYEETTKTEDMLVVMGKNKPTRFFIRGKEKVINGNILEVDCREEMPFCYFKNSVGAYGLMSKQGEIAVKPTFSGIAHMPFANVNVLTKNGYVFIFNDNINANFISEGTYASKLYHDRFMVEDRSGKRVVSKEGKLIIPPIKGKSFSRFAAIDEFGTSLIKWQNGKENILFTNDGEELARWSDNTVDEYFYSQEYLKGLNWSLIKSFSESDLDKVNPLGVWCKKITPNKRNVVLANSKNQNITHNFQYIKRIKGTSYFLIQTMSGKYGVIKIE